MFFPVSMLTFLSIFDKRKKIHFGYTEYSIFSALLFPAWFFKCLCIQNPMFFYLLYLDSSLSADVSCSQCRCGANLTELGRYARSCSSHWTLHKKPHVWQPVTFLFLLLLLLFKKCRDQPCTYIYWPSSAALSWCRR